MVTTGMLELTSVVQWDTGRCAGTGSARSLQWRAQAIAFGGEGGEGVGPPDHGAGEGGGRPRPHLGSCGCLFIFTLFILPFFAVVHAGLHPSDTYTEPTASRAI
jgi:hypothetical protein